MKHMAFSTAIVASLLTLSVWTSQLPAAAAEYYRDGVLVQRSSVLSDVLNSPILGGSNYNWQYSPYSSGYRDGYRDGTRYTRYDLDRYDGYADHDWRPGYPPGHYHGKGKKLGHYKHHH